MVNRRKRSPSVPPERGSTIRQRIAEVLEEGPLSAKDISGLVRISEKEVTAHLPSLERTFKARGRTLVLEPAVCRGCGFVFRKRKRYTKPGRCPLCKGEAVDAPLYSIRS